MEENNRIIAEFMGYTLNENNEYPIEYITVQGHWDTCPIQDLNYHKSWDWLIPVVEKIESIRDSYHGRFGVYINSNSCTIQSTNFRPDKPISNPPHYYDNFVLNNKIESTYYSIINFINFYNKRKEEEID